MKKWIWIPVFLVVLLGGDRLGGLILDNMLMKADFRYSRMYGPDHEGADLLFLGNSRGLMFFQPEIEELTAKSTMNLSYNGLPMQMGEVLVKDYLDENPNTKTLLLEVTMADRLNVPLVSGFNAYKPYSERIKEIVRTNSANSYYGAIVSHLYRYNSEIFQRGIRYLKGTDKAWLTDRVINDYTIKQAAIETPLDFTFQEARDKGEFDANLLISQIQGTVEYAQAKGVKVHLLVNPYYPPFFERSIGFSDWKTAVEEATGLAVRDYSNLLEDPKYFTDYQHCNKEGSKIFVKKLQEEGLLE